MMIPAATGARLAGKLMSAGALALALTGSVMYVVHTIKRAGAIEHSYHQARAANKKLAENLARIETINAQHQRNAARAGEQIEAAAVTATTNKSAITEVAPAGADQTCPIDCVLP